ncbi:hypothetical protein GWC77_22380 [Paraburkholderia sp. NMBU_R16]|nr:hypothetical protein [Paraburkholderia sp. NMBU_R16]
MHHRALSLSWFESREPRAESREPRAESREPRAESRLHRADLNNPEHWLASRGSSACMTRTARRARAAWRH